ncbi:Ergothioneine biosynthesis protein EgtB [Bordetella sputigena]|uniref:ergothioneine biosynthesis protein EgtB n=1 Tax=Bordetella sputigena TaxID=1416810 RepID=UPI0039F0C5B5
MDTPQIAARATPSADQDGEHLLAQYLMVRDASRGLAAPLSAEDCQAQSMPDASPVKWHLAHTTWFFETFLLQPHLADYSVFHPRYGFLFNSYYNAIGERHPRPQRGLLTRPPLQDVLAYRAHVDAGMARLIPRVSHDAEIGALVRLGLHHEQQHQELILTDVKHLLSCNALRPAYTEAPTVSMAARPSLEATPPRAWVDHPGGIVTLGHQGAGFCFDNETPAHQVLLRPFKLARRPVTQGEYLEFIKDGGYGRPELWLSLGWDTVRSQGWQAPLYWEDIDGEWQAFTLRGMEPIDPHAPVTHISYFEADAYARWAGARLPREAEWEQIARGLDPLDPHANLVESGHFHPRAAPSPGPVNAPLQMYGDVWEWTASPYEPYPGFSAAAGAVGEYNGKFMCNQYVLRGGSCATPRSHIRATYRNFFPPDARWQFSGLRLARDA